MRIGTFSSGSCEVLAQEKQWIGALVFFVFLIIFLNIVNILCGEPFWQITRLIDVGLEANIPTWFSSLMIAACAYFAWGCSREVKVDQAGKRMWRVLALGLLAMSCDETAMIHENIGKVLYKYWFQFLDIGRSPWIILLGPFVLVAILWFVGRLRR